MTDCILTGKRLDQVYMQLGRQVRETMDTETMNFIAFLTFVTESNKNMSFKSRKLNGWLSGNPAD